jgi:hypothetical protein
MVISIDFLSQKELLSLSRREANNHNWILLKLLDLIRLTG